jgi:hypothetical protein
MNATTLLIFVFGACIGIVAVLLLIIHRRRKQQTHFMPTKEHYVSRVLLRRFARKKLIEAYNIKHGKWKTTSIKSVFFSVGYNQLLAFGKVDNTLDVEFKKLENSLPKTLAALDDAATRTTTILDVKVYDHLCWYCAFLWQMSPFAKAVAPVNFVNQLELDLKHGNVDMLKALGHSERNIAEIKKHYVDDQKFIITGKNFLQLVYRIQFSEQCKLTYSQFRHSTKWTVYNSPIELPISDIAITQYHDMITRTAMYILPIAPKLVLFGALKLGDNLESSNDTIIKGDTLPADAAEDILDVICKSAFYMLGSQNRIGDINGFRQRAAKKKIAFVKMNQLEAVLSAGLKSIESEKDFLITPTTRREQIRFITSWISPERVTH